ncbi:MAG TPA: alkaline phosphatase D family protein [Chitinophagaceae bacterium]|jgi:alkaline phosphatase D|nr:alkaline phosphatase D family protein [Chitinophagaceae bacterium]
MRPFCLFLLLFSLLTTRAQIVSGPMLGPVELRDAKIWVEVAPSVSSLSLQVFRAGTTGKPLQVVPYRGTLGQPFNPVQFTVGGLEPNTSYEYVLVANGKPVAGRGRFTTKDLWQWRKPAPDFSFITGSCSYFNEPAYDRPGKPYGGDSSIFTAMAREKAAFMLWLGDNWYTREVDYYSEWGLWYRAQHDRRQPVLQPLLRAMPHLAAWDDHDFGPNNSGRSFLLKETSRNVFRSYWANPGYGEGGEGVYTQFSWSDVDFFLCDDRWWRSADDMKDSVDGKPNPEKIMLGARQLNWLKNALLFSTATFKIIVVGSQVLNPVSTSDKLLDYSAEYGELMHFLEKNRINGVLFMSGDRHHSEVIRVNRPGTYALYDLTVSPLTSGTHSFYGTEKNNPYRVVGVDQKQNYGRVTVSGARGKRVLALEFLGINGERLNGWSISETELKSPAAR